MVTEPSACTARKLSSSFGSSGLAFAGEVCGPACAKARRAPAMLKPKLTMSAPPVCRKSRRDGIRGTEDVFVIAVSSLLPGGAHHRAQDSRVRTALAQIARQALLHLIERGFGSLR